MSKIDDLIARICPDGVEWKASLMQHKPSRFAPQSNYTAMKQ